MRALGVYLHALRRRGLWSEAFACCGWSACDWIGLGEEWTASPEWKQELIKDAVARWIPEGRVVLEIGPGAGRWLEVLAARASRLVLVDVSERPLELCQERFNGDTRIEYVLCSGSDLPGVEDGSITSTLR